MKLFIQCLIVCVCVRWFVYYVHIFLLSIPFPILLDFNHSSDWTWKKYIHDSFVRTYSPVTQPFTQFLQCAHIHKYTRTAVLVVHTHTYIRECVSCILSFNMVFSVLCPVFCLYHTVSARLLFLLHSLEFFFIILWVFSLPSWYSFFFSIPFPPSAL